jgi:hypothetical protein
VHCYVTIHDSALVRDCEDEGRFTDVEHTYLFVGPRPVRDVPRGTSVIVAREYHPNYEHYPDFYDFTGWWVLARHDLARARFLTVQYDHQLHDRELAEKADVLLDRGGPVAYVAGHRHANNWMLLLDGFEAAFNAGMAAVGIDPGQFPDFDAWPSTQGMAWNRDDLYEFMGWFEPLFGVWAGNVWAGHLAERSVWAWMMSTGRSPVFGSGLVHEGRDSHGTCSLMAGNSEAWEQRQATFGR